MNSKIASLVMTFLVMLSTAFAKAADPQARLSMIDELFHDYNQPNVPGASVLVVQNGRPLLSRSYGLADVEARIPCTPATDFRLASVTKQFTAMAIMILAEEGKLSLDDSITKFFPEFPDYGKPITVRQLLHHTSGLTDYEDLIPDKTTIPVLDINVLRLLEQQDKTYFAPGSQFRYSNTGFAFLALIVEKASGRTFASFLNQNIFKPLKMTNSLAYEQGLSVVPNRAYGHSKKGDAFARTDQSLTSSVLGDGGVYSSIDDLFKWDQSLCATKLVSRKMLKEAFTPGANTLHNKNAEYGFGWQLTNYRGLREIYHTGDSIGFRTIIVRLPEKKFTVVILTNRSQPYLGDIAHKIVDTYLFDGR